MHLDATFQGRVSGHVYAQPLYWERHGSNSGMLLVATEDATVHALDAMTGQEVWQRVAGRPVPRSSLPCGNINPVGITRTPVIDDQSGAIYFDAMVMVGSGLSHLLFALSLKDGTPLTGWPVDVARVLRSEQSFNAAYQGQRGALTILGGALYVPFGGHYGDCGHYHGGVVGVSLNDPRRVISWATRGAGGGIWAPGGISSDGSLPLARWFGVLA
jgi:outer membrane protein assembly factor BamB